MVSHCDNVLLKSNCFQTSRHDLVTEIVTLELECLLLGNLLDLFLNILMFTETLHQHYKTGLMPEELRRIGQDRDYTYT